LLELAGGKTELAFETVELLQPEQGRYRVETFNALRLQASALLRHRTANVRIKLADGIRRVYSPTHPVLVAHPDRRTSTLKLEVGGAASAGLFRFFIEPETLPSTATGGQISSRLPTEEREFVEPRRFRLRRRASLRRLLP